MVEDRRSGGVGQAAVLEVLGSTRIDITFACSGSASARIDITSARINNGGRKISSAYRHCQPESICASKKSLRILIEIALENFQIVWKASGWSGYFPDNQESFQLAWIISSSLERFRIVRIFSGWSGKFSDSL